MKSHAIYDVIIIGGSYSGLSAALTLGRSLKSVLIIDSGLPCNRQTPHSHNFITQDGEKPAKIAEKAKDQVLKYDTVKFVNDWAVSGSKNETGFEIITQNGDQFIGKKLVFATGIKDVLPNIKGFAECWGISMIHCPYCHGYEFRGKNTGIISNGDNAFHMASLVNNLTDDLKILTNGKSQFSDEQLAKIAQHNIEIIETEISEIIHENGYIRYVIFKDGRQVNFDAIYASVPFVQHTDIPATLGCEFTDSGYIKVDNFQATTIEGIYACGDNATMMRSIANAAYMGNITGAFINKELTHAQF